jgi:hypothetical protein
MQRAELLPLGDRGLGPLAVLPFRLSIERPPPLAPAVQSKAALFPVSRAAAALAKKRRRLEAPADAWEGAGKRVGISYYRMKQQNGAAIGAGERCFLS